MTLSIGTTAPEFEVTSSDGRPLKLADFRGKKNVVIYFYPQDFTGVNTDTGKGMRELKNYIETIRRLPLSETCKEAVLGGTAARLLGL